MRVADLKEGDRISIRGEEYEVLFCGAEADFVPSMPVRQFYAAYLKLAEAKGERPTHELRRYADGEHCLIGDARNQGEDGAAWRTYRLPSDSAEVLKKP